LSPYATVQSYVWSGVLLCGTNDYVKGRKLIEKGYELAMRHRNSMTAARAMRNLSLISLMMGYVDDALLYAQEAQNALTQRRKASYWLLESFLRVDKRFQRMSTLLTLGRIHFYKGKFDQAGDHFERAEQTQKQAFKNYPTLKGLWCLWYCDFLLARGRIDEALRRAEQALIDPERPKGWGEGVFGAPAANLALATCLIYKAESEDGQADLSTIRRVLNEAWSGIADRGRTEWLKPVGTLQTRRSTVCPASLTKRDPDSKRLPNLQSGRIC